jgi:hypothetical protein
MRCSGQVARSYLLDVGNLDWKQINPDIFGSMIQAIAEEEPGVLEVAGDSRHKLFMLTSTAIPSPEIMLKEPSRKSI